MMFHKFYSQDEIRNFGGSLFIEIQYCKLQASTRLRDIVSTNSIKHWCDDSLYIYADDMDNFFEAYKDILGIGTYNNLKTGLVDLYGINYYLPKDIELIKSRLIKLKPNGYEMLFNWLDDNDNCNGFYVLGI